MADRKNRAHPPIQRNPHSRSAVVQNKPPGAVVNGVFQPNSAFQPEVTGVSPPASQTVPPTSGPLHSSVGVNGYTAPPPSLQQSYHPGMIPGSPSPTVGGQLVHTQSLSVQRPPGHFPPPPAPLPSQVPGRSFNGPGSVGSRPPVSPDSYQGTTSSGYGSLSPNDVREPSPGSLQPQGYQSSELPVPFEQAHYSHQMKPQEQRSPITTPSVSGPSSERSSRGSSPVSGSSVGATEGQFISNSGSRRSPVPTSVPDQPHTRAGTYPPPRQGQLPAHSVTQNVKAVPDHSSINQHGSGFLSGPRYSSFMPQPPGQPAQYRPQAPPPPAHEGPRQPDSGIPLQPASFGHQSVGISSNVAAISPPATGFVHQSVGIPSKVAGISPPLAGFLPPTGANLSNTTGISPPAAGIPLLTASFSPPPSNIPSPAGGIPLPPASTPYPGISPRATGMHPQTATGFPLPSPGIPPLSIGISPPPVSGFPPPGPGNFSRIPASTEAQARFPPPLVPSAPDHPQPPVISPGTLIPPAAGRLGNLPPLPGVPGSFPLPAAASGFSPLPGLPPPPMGGSVLNPQFPQAVSPRSGSPTSPYEPQIPSVQGSHYHQPGAVQQGVGAYTKTTSTVTQRFSQLGIQDSQRVINLLNERQLIPPEGIETARKTLAYDFNKVNCSPEIFRCTLNAVPQNSALLNKARLPLGILIHPFKDLSQLPVIQSNVIVRCRSCRTYINPFVVFVDQRRWKCNLCYRVNDLPDEFSFDPISKTYGDPQRRPEVKTATIEFIAPSEYMLRPPQPAVYLFLLDVSFNAVETGYLSEFCKILLSELDNMPGDSRMSIGVLCYDSMLYYFNLSEGLSQPHMLCVPDLEDMFLPCPDNLLVNLHESRELVVELLTQLPKLFESNYDSGSALGAALQAALKLMSPTGGRVTVMQTCLPTVGPGALHNRDTGNTSGKNVTIIGPATDFYKKLSLDCSAKQVAVDLFMLNGQYADIATLSCISKYSAGCIYYYPSFHTVRNSNMVRRFDADFRRYLTRKIGFESVMRIRCTRGLSIHTFHGNLFVRSTDLLSLPNINPDAGFGMQMSIEDNLAEAGTVSFQAALLYTSSKGERRIRVHTLCLPVTDQLSEVFTSADQMAIAALLSKMAVDRSLNSAIGDARESMINACMDALMAYNQQIPANQRVGALLAPSSLRLMPMFMLSMLKNLAFSLSGNTKVDDRVFAMQQFKILPVTYLIQKLYPHLYPLHRLSDEKPIKHGKEEIPSAPILQLLSVNIDRTGLFLLDTGEIMYLLVGSAIGDQMCQDVFGKPNFSMIADGMNNLPVLKNPTSEKIHSFINYLKDSRPNGVTILVLREDSKQRHLFTQHLLAEKTENSMSYYEFLQYLQGKGTG